MLFTGGFASPPGSNNWFWKFPCSSKAFTYTNWMPGEPNNYGGTNEDAMMTGAMYNKWVDVTNDVPYYAHIKVCYVCECHL